MSLVVSLVVLFYEIYLFVLDCRRPKDKNMKVSDESSHANEPNEKHITENNLSSLAYEKKFSEDYEEA